MTVRAPFTAVYYFKDLGKLKSFFCIELSNNDTMTSETLTSETLHAYIEDFRITHFGEEFVWRKGQREAISEIINAYYSYK